MLPAWLLILITTLAWGFWGICNKLAVHGLTPIQVQIVNELSMIAMIPIFLWIAKSSGRPLVWEPKSFAWAIAGSLAASVASTSYMFALTTRNASTVVGLTAAYPSVTFLLAVLLLGERPALTSWIGLLCVQFGVWLISR